MFARFPSPTPFGLGLGSDCPRADEPAPGTLRLSVRGILTPVIAYSFRHPHFRPLHQNASTLASPLPERSPTIRPSPEGWIESAASAIVLSPDHYRRRRT